MARPYIINALDIGSGFLKLVTISKRPKEEDFEILGFAKEPSIGIRKGVIIDIQKVAEKIAFLVRKVEQDCGQKINNIYANITGGHIFCTCSRGLVSVSRADQKISEEDVERVLRAARAISLSSNKEIIEVFPKEFIVDGEAGVREPVGMEGVRLEVEALILCGFSPYLKNSSQAILKAGLQINDLILNSLASARAVLTSREKELGVCVLDIGAGVTDMAVFEEGNLLHTAIFPIGSGHITSDIAICLKTDIDAAEKIKLEFGTCETAYSKKDGKKIKIIRPGERSEEEQLLFSREELANIIGARVSEIFELVNKELKKISRQEMLPAGVVLTGGGARLPKIKNLARKELKLPCRVGASKISANFQEDPSLSTLYGLILEGFDVEEGRGNFSNFGKGIKEQLKRFFRTLIP
ncbi:MAG: cell division protein FtsA [Candidatus Nealsonbacteria bacterium CG10_big_fil_rev_8_21_14_0_10_36_24]|uniref:Cell division protein FtsA n=2 Tax=Candidatus Nealsoniibacteriota TaxID=1817911 RepID=A0A2M6NS41_9BACT|nr:MAG: cell division protein FtsA [Candidatus Nealsonbacteria bacterium CG10_big_fil_rev_8_21_14_0_10_36_24]